MVMYDDINTVQNMKLVYFVDPFWEEPTGHEHF